MADRYTTKLSSGKYSPPTTDLAHLLGIAFLSELPDNWPTFTLSRAMLVYRWDEAKERPEPISLGARQVVTQMRESMEHGPGGRDAMAVLQATTEALVQAVQLLSGRHDGTWLTLLRNAPGGELNPMS